MRIIKMGDLVETELECLKCNTVFGYNKYDIKTKYGNWVRTGIESSERWIVKIVECPVCGKNFEIKREKEYY